MPDKYGLTSAAETAREMGYYAATANPRQAAVIRSAHYALEARGRGKSGVHTTTDACRVIRSLLDVLAELTGIDSASDTLA